MTLAAENPISCEADGISLSRRAVKIGKLSTVYALGQVVPKIVGLALVPVFTRYLVPAQLGIVWLCAPLAGPMLVCVQLGLGVSPKTPPGPAPPYRQCRMWPSPTTCRQ